MRRLKKFTTLSRADRRVFFEALLLVGSTRLALWLMPFAAVQQRVSREPRPHSPHPTQPYQPDRIVWAVRAAARCVPFATCLTQALAAQGLLLRHGHASRVEIGVAKDSASRFEAHAWLVFEGRVVIGGPSVERFTPLTAWEARS